MIAASTITRKMPVNTAGKSSALMVGRIVSGSARPPKRTRPDIPANTAPTSNTTMQITASQATAHDLVLALCRDEPGEKLRSSEESQADPDEPDRAGNASGGPTLLVPSVRAGRDLWLLSWVVSSPQPPTAAIPTIGNTRRPREHQYALQ